MEIKAFLEGKGIKVKEEVFGLAANEFDNLIKRLNLKFEKEEDGVLFNEGFEDNIRISWQRFDNGNERLVVFDMEEGEMVVIEKGD